jgi:hypothetical protein
MKKLIIDWRRTGLSLLLGLALAILFLPNKDRNISCILQFTQNTDSLFIKRTDQEISQSR